MDRWSAKQLVSASLKVGMRRGEPDIRENLCVVPLFSRELSPPSYPVLKEALRSGDVELQEGLGMSELLLTNKGGVAVLILQGQELLGRSQHRQVNVSILAAPGQTKVPVTCLQELKGLSYGSAFYWGQFTYPAIRSHTISSTSHSLWSGNGWRADQTEVWWRISDYYEKSNLGRTQYVRHQGSFHAVNEAIQRQNEFRELVGAFSCTRGQCGAIFVAGGEVVAMEFTGSLATWSEVHNDVVSSYISESLLSGSGKPVDAESLEILLTRFAVSLEDMEVSIHRGVGLGFNVRIRLKGYVGECLIHQGQILHCIVVKAPKARAAVREERVSSRDWVKR